MTRRGQVSAVASKRKCKWWCRVTDCSMRGIAEDMPTAMSDFEAHYAAEHLEPQQEEPCATP